ncbi:MAG: efflux RND transporter permease subunit [Rhodanobacter sp.]
MSLKKLLLIVAVLGLAAVWIFWFGHHRESSNKHVAAPPAIPVKVVLFHASLDLFAFVGIVKKNAIMLIDFALERQNVGNMLPHEAIFEACKVRFRPIMMTTMSAFAGTLPIALGIGAGAETRRSLGLAVWPSSRCSRCI